MVVKTVIEAGKMGKERLAMKAGLSRNTVEKVFRGQAILPTNAFKLAKACGATDDEAHTLSSDQARTAS